MLINSVQPQAYGAKNYKMLGILLQRAQVILWVLCIPIVALWVHIDHVLLTLGQEPEVKLARATVWLIPASG